MEKRYESDLTRKEKWQLELKKLKGMGFKDKVIYICTYYKIVFAGILGLIIVISLGMQIYHNSQLVELLSIAIVDAGFEASEKADLLDADLLEYMGTGDKNEIIQLDTTVMSQDEYSAVMKLTVVLGTGSTDILICNDVIYDKYKAQDGFLEWEEILGEDYSEYEQYMTNGMLDLSKCKNWEKYNMVYYEPTYAAVIASTKKPKNCVKFLELMTK